MFCEGESKAGLSDVEETGQRESPRMTETRSNEGLSLGLLGRSTVATRDYLSSTLCGLVLTDLAVLELSL